MNRRPVSYLQIDPRWKNIDYSTKGESTTIGRSGCGPTCAAMLIETLTGKTFTPADACAWSLAHNYKALNQGTYYAYFAPQFAAFGIKCEQLNWTNITKNGKKSNPIHKTAFDLLKKGYYLIACMGKGTWTSSGHFVVVWWEDGKVRINDPASTKEARLNGDYDTFCSEVKYYWAIDAVEFNREEEEDMDDAKFKEHWQRLRKELQDNDSSPYSDAAKEWITKKSKLIVGNGTIAEDGEPNYMWEDLLTREQMAVLLYRYTQYLQETLGIAADAV